ncbi:DNA topoisomerase IB [Parasphingorhabdus sp.]|uniref:DNA topoisomerase IB n=1 Tax=Parasphingorhabdus sp. TaxID=2709688 RepID=UPI003594291A
MPPAYSDVWICATAEGHIQATGYDSASRKQYRYHDDWIEFRNRQKFDRLGEFAGCLPGIRRQVTKLLNKSDDTDRFSKEMAIAAVVRLIDNTAMRVGGRSKTARGATTLRINNVTYKDGKLHLRYRAKGGKRVECSIRDTKLQAILEEIDDLPGKQLFQYIGEDSEVHRLDSGDVNQWLKECSKMDYISAKTFRTWHGSVAALDSVYKNPEASIKSVCEAAAQILCNTPAICRASYVHPEVIRLIEMDRSGRERKLGKAPMKISGLRVAENRFAALIL